MSNHYQPIDCGMYDYLEAWAVQRVACEIHYFTNDGQLQILQNAQIRDLQTRDKAEFMILETGQEIRLDRLVRVHGLDLGTGNK